jgi:signal transduction histidine kinase
MIPHVQHYSLSLSAIVCLRIAILSALLMQGLFVAKAFGQDTIPTIREADITWAKRGLKFTNFPSLNLADKGWKFLPHLDTPILDSTDLATSRMFQSLPISYYNLQSVVDSGIVCNGWYYLQFRVAKDLHGRALAVVFSMPGAYDIYIDGRLMVSYGKPAIDPRNEIPDSYAQYIIRFMMMNGDSTRTHIIAVRYSAHTLARSYQTYGASLLPREMGIRAVLSYPEEVKRYYDYERVILLTDGVVAGVPLIMIFIHLFFFLADRSDRSQLYLGLFNFFSTIIRFASITSRIHIGQSVELASISNIIFSALGTPLIASLLILIPSLFRLEYSKIRVAVQVVAIWSVIVLALIAKFTKMNSFSVHWILIAFYVILLVEVIIMSIRVVRLRQQEGTIIGIGISVLALGLLSSIIPVLNGMIFANRTVLMYIFGYVFFYTALPITFSIITGLRFFKQNRALRTSTLEIERVNNELRDANQYLEQRVEERTRQLTDANEEVSRQLELLDEQSTEIEMVNVALSESNTHLEEKNFELRQLNKEKNEFLGIAAHDLKNPLTGIRLSVEVILRALDTMERSKLVNRIEAIGTTAERMTNIVSQLLDANALESGNVQYHFSRESVGYILHKAVSASRDYAHSKSISIILEVPADTYMYILVDKEKFRDVLDNLISNAIKYSPRETTVYVRAMLHDGNVRIDICDQGLGIAPDEMDKLFLRFSKLSATPTAGESSTGLGLSIVKRFVEAMNGRVRAESPGKNLGSTFTIELPEIQ